MIRLWVISTPSIHSWKRAGAQLTTGSAVEFVSGKVFTPVPEAALDAARSLAQFPSTVSQMLEREVGPSGRAV